MARRIRLRYLEKVLRQPISYFDHHTPGSIAASLSTDTNIIEVGLADKVVSIFQACGMVLVAFVIAFTKSWKMTLVVGTVIPYVLLVTMALGSLVSMFEKKLRDVYSKASSVAEEALSSILNVTALGAKDKIVERFKRILTVAGRYAIRKGPVEASIYGNMFFSMQSAYALSLFYGVHLVSTGEIKDGGTVIMFVNRSFHSGVQIELIYMQRALLYDNGKLCHGSYRTVDSQFSPSRSICATSSEITR